MKRISTWLVTTATALAVLFALLLALPRQVVPDGGVGAPVRRLAGFAGYTNRVLENDTAVFRFTNTHGFPIDFAVYEHPPGGELSRGILHPGQATNLLLSLSSTPSWLQLNYSRQQRMPLWEIRNWFSKLVSGRSSTPRGYVIASDEMRLPERVAPVGRAEGRSEAGKYPVP